MAESGSRANHARVPQLQAAVERQQPRLCQSWKEGKDCSGQRRQAGKQAQSSCKTFPFSSSLESTALSACSRSGRNALGSPGDHPKSEVFFRGGIIHVGREQTCYVSAFNNIPLPV